MYLDELFVLSKAITKRKIDEYRIQLAIATNPHTKDSRKLWSQFDVMERRNEGKEYLDSEFDAAGMERLKQKLQRQGSGIRVK